MKLSEKTCIAVRFASLCPVFAGHDTECARGLNSSSCGKTTPAKVFATTDHVCLGPLRSQIAQGQFNGVGPFGEHFNGTVDPGAHYGTAGEGNFLTSVLGVKDVTSFCSSIS